MSPTGLIHFAHSAGLSSILAWSMHSEKGGNDDNNDNTNRHDMHPIAVL